MKISAESAYPLHSTSNYSTIFLGEQNSKGGKLEAKVISNLISLLTDEANKELKQDALNELRKKNEKALLIQAISENKKHPKLSALVAACWETGMDFSEEISFFVVIALECSYTVCLEAMTVIENAVNDVNRNAIIDSIKKLESEIQKKKSEKINLYSEIILTLKNKL